MRCRLIILRHAKSAWGSDAPSDHERPLNERGRGDAPAVASRLEELAWRPQAVFSSDAKRTRETWDLMAPYFTPHSPPHFTRTLYLAGLEDFAPELAKLDEHIDTAMVIGHNPGWESAASALSGQSLTMTTCNAALLEVDADNWSEACSLESCWKLVALLRPKEL